MLFSYIRTLILSMHFGHWKDLIFYTNARTKNIIHLMKHYIFLLLVLIFGACTPAKKSIRILYFSTDTNSQDVAKFKKAALKNDWSFLITTSKHYFHEDSLSQMDAVFLPFSSLNQLTYQELPILKRYLEAGRGGVVTIQDTTLLQTQWPWLQSWNLQKDDAEWLQDKGWVAQLRSDFNEGDLKRAISQKLSKSIAPDYAGVKTLSVPDSTRYTRTVLVQGLDEPLGMAILPNHDVLLAERKGSLKIYNRLTKQIKLISNFNVFSGIEDGLLGLAIDPKFSENHWIYFYYALGGDRSVNRLSRFLLDGDSLVQTSEKILLEIPTQRKYCCHSAGYISFDTDGLLYLSTGDNTNAEETEGYTPVDERPGRVLADDQATAANTNDLRGKILRIKPMPNGTYSIPRGNLFTEGNSKGRPEIYVMGSRNPYRFSVDRKNNYLYWGDVGPDTKVQGQDGELMSYDEINQARKPGFYGWPYFLGNNEAFPKYNYATKKEGPKKDPLNPINDSPNNTGQRVLPAAQPAMIWYGKKTSKHFPILGNGGASAMAGPVYYSDLFPTAPFKLHDYYNGKLFIYDWIRGWIMAVTLDENGNYLRTEPFLKHYTFQAPVDMQFSKDGALYVLEYGTNWFSKNTDARLVRIEFVEGNRNPVAEIEIAKQYGAAPFTVQFSGKKTIDHDRADQLTYTWDIENKQMQGQNATHTFNTPGVYNITLTVRDDKGGQGLASSQIFVGNTPPEVKIETRANRSFYWDNSVLDYAIQVEDKEDKIINQEKINLSYGFIARGKDIAVILTQKQQNFGSLKYLKGQQLAANLDCKSCHSIDKASVGPAYLAIAKRYAGKEGVIEKLSTKIIQGGSGVWGERAMIPHPSLSKNDAAEIVNYILSLSDKPEANHSLKNAVVLKEHIGKEATGTYLLNVSYTDQGANGIEPLQSRSYITLRNPFVQAEDFDDGNVRIATYTTAALSYARAINHTTYIRFNQIDLTHIKQIKYRVEPQSGGEIELRLGNPEGPLVSTVKIPPGIAKDPQSWKEIWSDLIDTKGLHDLYFVFKAQGERKQNLFHLDWIYFSNNTK